MKTFLDRFNQFSLLVSHFQRIITLCLWIVRYVSLCIRHLIRLSILSMTPHEQILISNLPSFPLPIWLIVELILIEVRNQGALLFVPGEFSGEFRDSLCLNVFQDVNVFSETFDRLMIPFVLKFAPLPAASISTDAADTEFVQDPCHQVRVVRIIEVTLLNHGIEEMILSFLIRLRNVRVCAIIIVRLGRSRIHRANELGLKPEILVRLNYAPEECPNQRGKASNETQD